MFVHPAQDEAELLQVCSRHKAYERPQDTPDGFWELSFQDSIANR